MAGINFRFYCISGCLVLHEQLVTYISIQYRLVCNSVYIIRFCYCNYRINYGNVLFCKSSSDKTGNKFKNRIKRTPKSPKGDLGRVRFINPILKKLNDNIFCSYSLN